MSGDELIDVRLPRSTVERMVRQAGRNSYVVSLPNNTFDQVARTLVEHNPDLGDSLRPLTRGDFAKRDNDPFTWVIVGQYEGSGDRYLIGVSRGSRSQDVWDYAPAASKEDRWRRCDPPSDPAVKAALLKAAFIEDES